MHFKVLHKRKAKLRDGCPGYKLSDKVFHEWLKADYKPEPTPTPDKVLKFALGAELDIKKVNK